MKCVESVKISSYETIFYLDLQDLTYFPSLILTSVLVAVEENLANLCYFMSFPLGNFISVHHQIQEQFIQHPSSNK